MSIETNTIKLIALMKTGELREIPFADEAEMIEQLTDIVAVMGHKARFYESKVIIGEEPSMFVNFYEKGMLIGVGFSEPIENAPKMSIEKLISKIK